MGRSNFIERRLRTYNNHCVTTINGFLVKVVQYLKSRSKRRSLKKKKVEIGISQGNLEGKEEILTSSRQNPSSFTILLGHRKIHILVGVNGFLI